MTPLILEIIEQNKQSLKIEDRIYLDSMTKILKDWHGNFGLEDIGASIYIKWYIQFVRNLYSNYVDGEDDRMAMSDNYHFTDAFQNIIESIHKEREQSRFQILCKGAYKDYSGPNYCAWSITMALVETS